jgi:iron complex outermembrane receptor protein
VKKLILLCSTAFVVPTAAFAQSTGTLETEKDTIVVTGTRSASKGTSGVQIQDSTKAKGLVTQEFIAKQSPGQTVLNTINYVPGVNFTNSDAYGTSGGNIRIRGFDGNRISLTFDGAPLNDSGNYAIYSNQQLDPELVEQVNVNLGATDVDSPTASAAGGTVNYRSLLPTNNFGMTADASVGSFRYRRIFGLVQTGQLTSFGTKAWFAGSRNTYNHWRGDGKISKWQINGKIYQPLSGGDFVSLSAHYNQNRNNNYNNPNLSDLRTLLGSTVIPSTPTSLPVVVGDFSDDQWDKINDIAYSSDCGTRVAGVKGTAQNDPSACTNYLGVQINPSNSANVRGQSRFTLTPQLVLTVDPTYQYTLANGGGQGAILAESDVLLKSGVTGSPGIDLNGDGDFLDRVLVGRPSITNTNRVSLISSLVWKPSATNTFRLSYTFDRAHHRQTGEYSRTDNNFNLMNPFFGRNGEPILNAAGEPLQNRDRTSIAMLNQLSGQYIGKFFENRLRLEIGLRSPWFKRDLDQNCYTPVKGQGFPLCISNAVGAGYTVVPDNTNPTTAGNNDVYAPFETTYKFHKLLPNIGATYALTDSVSIFGSFAKGFSAPRTDNLYRQPVISITPESTNSYDLGARYLTRLVQAQATLWKIDYKNRIVSSYDPETNLSIDRNVGKVKSWGVDASLGVRPLPQLALLGLASYTKARLQEDLLLGTTSYNPTTPPTLLSTQYFCSTLPTATAPVNVCARTAGKFVVETPKWQFGGRAELTLRPVTLGVQAKHVGDRFATDVNDVISKGYTTVDLDARFDLDFIPNKKSYFQLNVINLFNEHYFGNLSTTINAYGVGSSAPRFTPVSTRAVTGTLTLGF